ncbi:hypothetical protein GCM10007874_11030 [Labrys miyagiensis]|uniref:Uncharacterized protein n=1 Tax=Labrys miyagiensis TaxID=346912 RepID=A0ABQ6CII5_9HYPH|nr:hypothetical protein GCM10007874_11030 [Labrys miyagiensis]
MSERGLVRNPGNPEGICAILFVRIGAVRSYFLVTDISGDRPNNSSSPPEPVRDQTVEQGITMNGLALNRLRIDLYDPNGQAADVTTATMLSADQTLSWS